MIVVVNMIGFGIFQKPESSHLITFDHESAILIPIQQWLVSARFNTDYVLIVLNQSFSS